MKLTKFYENDEDDFEIINNKKVLKDGRTLRVRTTMLDSKSLYPVRISDGSGDPLSLNKPGFRTFTDDKLRNRLADEKELDYIDYENAKATEWRDVSAPPNSTHPGWLQSSEEQMTEGQSCTVRNEFFPQHNGEPGTIKMYKGRLCCVPEGVTTDAAVADKYSIYDEYDAPRNWNTWTAVGAAKKRNPTTMTTMLMRPSRKRRTAASSA